MISPEKHYYLNEFKQANFSSLGHTLPWINTLRRNAIEQFAEQGFPTGREESWKYTRPASWLNNPFEIQTQKTETLITPSIIKPHKLSQHTMVFVDGCYSAALSSCTEENIGNLATLLIQSPQKIKPYLDREVKIEDGFYALNTAFMQDGLCLQIPANTCIPDPIQLLWITTGKAANKMIRGRHVFILGENSQASLIESYVSLDDAPYFTNSVTEVFLEKYAKFEHYKIQQENKKAHHFATQYVQQESQTEFTSHVFSLGGHWARNEVRVKLAGEGAACHLNGFYRADQEQQLDHFTEVDHIHSHCASREFYKGIAGGRARTIFNGKVIVRPKSQKSDAHLSNQNLLLSNEAEINTRPQLEIYADDVKCSHNATVGQLDENALFYLRSRGIGEAEAQSLLIDAFANEMIHRIKNKPLQDQLLQRLRMDNQRGE